MRELRHWLYIFIVIFLFLIFGVDQKQDPPHLTYFGVDMIFVLISLAIFLLIFQKRNDQ